MTPAPLRCGDVRRSRYATYDCLVVAVRDSEWHDGELTATILAQFGGGRCELMELDVARDSVLREDVGWRLVAPAEAEPGVSAELALTHA